jgi:hypothetical protein
MLEPPLRLRQPVINVPFEHGRLPDGRPAGRAVVSCQVGALAIC